MKRFLLTVCAVAGLAVAAMAADELKLTQGFGYSKNGVAFSYSQLTSSFDVSGNGVVQNVQSISTNILGDVLNMGGVTVQGAAMFKDIGPTFSNTNGIQTNFVQIGTLDSGGQFLAFLKINTNQVATVWLDSGALRARATGTNAVQLLYGIVDR